MTFEEYTDIVSDGGMDPRHQYEQEEKAKAVWEQAYRQGYKDGQYREGYKNGHAAVKQMEGE